MLLFNKPVCYVSDDVGLCDRSESGEQRRQPLRLSRGKFKVIFEQDKHFIWKPSVIRQRIQGSSLDY